MCHIRNSFIIMDILVACILVTFASIVSGDNSVAAPTDYMVCKPISGIFGTSSKDGNSVTSVLQGPEGKRGPPGKTGLRGPRGVANYDVVDRIVHERLAHIKNRIYQLGKEIEALPKQTATGGIPPTESTQQKANREECKTKFDSPINIGYWCYNILGTEGLLWSQPTAQSYCEKLGGNLADLETRDIYEQLYNYADEKFSQVVSAWTGMIYEGEQLKTRNGDPVVYAKWTSGYPRKSTSSYYASFTKVSIVIDTSAHVKRLLNSRPTDKKAYAICSYNLKGNSTTAASGGSSA